MLQLCLEQPLVTEMFGRFRQSHGWEHNGNRNVNHLIVIGLDGEAVFQLDEEQYHIRRGDMLIVPAETFYTAETRNGFEYDFLAYPSRSPASGIGRGSKISFRCSAVSSPEFSAAAYAV